MTGFSLKGPVVVRPVLLDTCAAIWLMDGAPMSPASRHSARAEGACRSVRFADKRLGYATLLHENRIQLNRPPEISFTALLALPGVRLTALSPALLMASALLPDNAPRDPADRIIAATARASGYTIVTRDGELVPYAAAGHIDVVAC